MSYHSHSCPLPSNTVALSARHFSAIGGLEKQAWRIAETFIRRRCLVHILTADKMPKTVSHPLIQLHSLPLKKWGNFRKLREFDRLCQKWQDRFPTDITLAMDRTSHQTHIRAGNGVHAAYLKQKGRYEKGIQRIKIALNPLHRTILTLEKTAFESPHLKVLFTNSHMVKQEILDFYKTPEEKIHVIHNGVEWKEMQKDFEGWLERKKPLCASLGLDPSLYHLLFIGNGYKRKGLIPLLKALSLLSSKEVHLSVIGKDSRIEEFIAYAASLGIKKRISFFGKQQDCRPFYQVADCLVIPSFYDPFANVTVEALAMGLYVISSKHNGGHEILQEETGTIIPDLSDPEAIAEALQAALLRPKTWNRAQIIRNSVKHLDFSNQLTTLINTALA